MHGFRLLAEELENIPRGNVSDFPDKKAKVWATSKRTMSWKQNTEENNEHRRTPEIEIFIDLQTRTRKTAAHPVIMQAKICFDSYRVQQTLHYHKRAVKELTACDTIS